MLKSLCKNTNWKEWWVWSWGCITEVWALVVAGVLSVSVYVSLCLSVSVRLSVSLSDTPASEKPCMNSSELGAIGWHCFLAIGLASQSGTGASYAWVVGWEASSTALRKCSLEHSRALSEDALLLWLFLFLFFVFTIDELARETSHLASFLDACFGNGGWGSEKPN